MMPCFVYTNHVFRHYLLITIFKKAQADEQKTCTIYLCVSA